VRSAVIGGVAALAAVGGLSAWARRRWVLVAVEGVSMTPTLRPGDRVLARRTPPATITTGDIVVATRPAGHTWSGPLSAGLAPPPATQRWVIKRAVAVPGDPVPVAQVPALAGNGHRTVPHGMYVLLGDNPTDSYDSRIFGFVPASRILGVVARFGA
jgi:signal peptidase I